jgi:hypothetical protein
LSGSGGNDTRRAWGGHGQAAKAAPDGYTLVKPAQ